MSDQTIYIVVFLVVVSVFVGIVVVLNYLVHGRWNGPASSGRTFRCPFCESTRKPKRTTKMSGPGCIVFVLLLIVCFPLAILSLFMTETIATCRDCGIKLG